jgi:hypothetical protein
MGQFCDARLGCVGCRSGADCNDDKPCTADLCNGNTCSNTVTCKTGQFCTDEGCVDCLYDSDCQGGGGGPVIEAAPPVSACPTMVCSGGKCLEKAVDCTGQQCCSPYGCCGIIINPPVQ